MRARPESPVPDRPGTTVKRSPEGIEEVHP